MRLQLMIRSQTTALLYEHEVLRPLPIADHCKSNVCPQVLGEYGLTNVLMSHGYNVATLMARYRPVR